MVRHLLPFSDPGYGGGAFSLISEKFQAKSYG